MPIIFFAYTDLAGRYQEVSYGHEQLESCLDLLTDLVREGCVLDKAYLIQQAQQMPLPIAAFDGQLLGPAINQPQEQRESVLA